MDLRLSHHSDCSVDLGGDNTTAQNLSSFRLSFLDNAKKKKAFLFPQIIQFCQPSHYFMTGILILVCIIKFTILKLILNGRHIKNFFYNFINHIEVKFCHPKVSRG